MNDKLNDALNNISDAYIQEAAGRPKRRYPYWFGAVAALLVISVLVSVLYRPAISPPTVQGTEPPAVPGPALPQSPGLLDLACQVSAAEYPSMAKKPNYEDYGSDHRNGYEADYAAWLRGQGEQYGQPDGYGDNLSDFFAASIPKFLNGEENSAYSPLNVYMALAMLAETTDSDSRQQILDLLGAASIETLRQQAGHVWNAHYCADGETATVLGNSLWLDDSFIFRQDTADLLAENYYASVFHGDLGSNALNKQLQTWLNSQTGGLLTEQAKNVEIAPGTAFTLASTLYFSAAWENEFSMRMNTDEIFHCADKDLITEFMHSTLTNYPYYCGSNFSAVGLELTGRNTMWLILPDEGVSVSDVLESDEYLQMTLAPKEWKEKASCTIHLNLPKFDVTQQQDLSEGIKELGITDVFDSTVSDFTSISDTPGMFLNRIDHAVRVAIDEEGCVGAAFTVMPVAGMPLPKPGEEIDFTLDRPFLFVVSSRDDLPLFAGTVCEP